MGIITGHAATAPRVSATASPAVAKKLSIPDPNYTEVPNEVFANLPLFGLEELRVILAATYHTMNWARSLPPLTHSRIMELTGLDREESARGIEAAVRRGAVGLRESDGVLVYRLLVQGE